MKESKRDGGLGFRDLHAFNLALLAKQARRLLTQPNTLLLRLLKAKYYPHGSVLEARVSAGCSYSWRSIASSLPISNMAARWRVGNGEDIRVWLDRWIPREAFFMCIRRNTDSPGDLLVADLITADRRWNVELVREYCLEEDARLILSIPLSENAIPDRLVWNASSSRIHTVCDGYYMARNFVKQQQVNSHGGGSSSGI